MPSLRTCKPTRRPDPIRTLSGLRGLGGIGQAHALVSPAPDCPLPDPSRGAEANLARLRPPSARLLIVSMSAPFTPIRRPLQYCRPLP